MPRNPLDSKAHTRATNRANHDLRLLHPKEWAELYAVRFWEARKEVRETDGLPLRCGPRPPDGQPVIDLDRLAADSCPGCAAHHDRQHFCPECGSDLLDWQAAPTPDARMEVLLRMHCTHCGLAGPYKDLPCLLVVGGRPRKRAAHEFVLTPKIPQGVQAL